MDEIEALILDAQRAFARRRHEISGVVDPQLRRSEMQVQIEREIEIGRHVVKLLAMRDITDLQRTPPLPSASTGNAGEPSS